MHDLWKAGPWGVLHHNPGALQVSFIRHTPPQARFLFPAPGSLFKCSAQIQLQMAMPFRNRDGERPLRVFNGKGGATVRRSSRPADQVQAVADGLVSSCRSRLWLRDTAPPAAAASNISYCLSFRGSEIRGG